MASQLADLSVTISGNDSAMSRTLLGIHSSLLGLGAMGSVVGAQTGKGISSGIGGGLAGLGGIAAAIKALAIGSVFSKMITGASHFNETINRTEVIFGDSAGVIRKSADEMASKYGIVRNEFMSMSSSIGQVLIGMGGQTRAAASESSAALTAMAAEASSLFDTSFADSARKITAALAGETEPIRAFGIDTQEAAVKQEALRMGLVKGTRELTTQEKVAARSSLIMKGLHKAQGDLANTQGSFANLSRAAYGRMQNALTTFGQSILPVVESLLSGFNKMMGGIETWVESNKSTFDSWAVNIQVAVDTVGWVFSQIGEAASALFSRISAEAESQNGFTTGIATAWAWLSKKATEIFDAIGFVFRNWSLIGEYAGVYIMEKMTNVGEIFTWLRDVASTFGEYMKNNWRALLQDAATAAFTILDNLAKNISDLFIAMWDAVQGKGFNFKFTPLLEGFKQTAEKFPEIAKPVFTSMQSNLDEITNRMGKNEAARDAANVQAAADALKPKPEAAKKTRHDEVPKEEDVPKSAKAATMDLAAFATKLQEGALGKNSEAKATAKNTAETAKHLAKITTSGVNILSGAAGFSI